MASIKKEAVGRKDLFLIEPGKIHEKDDWNVREEPPELERHIDELAVSIAEIGVQQPITVYMESDVIYLSDGHCRLAAVKLAISRGAEIKAIPCRVEDRYANDADRVLAMITRNSGKPLTPLEKAKVVRQLIDFGWTEKDIAAKIGVTAQYVHKLLEMQAMPEGLKKQVSEGVVSASTALDEHKISGAQATENIREAAEEAEKKTGKKKVTKKSLKKKNAVPPENKALEVIEKWAYKYTPDVEDKIYDLCNELNNLLVDGNLNEQEND